MVNPDGAVGAPWKTAAHTVAAEVRASTVHPVAASWACKCHTAGRVQRQSNAQKARAVTGSWLAAHLDKASQRRLETRWLNVRELGDFLLLPLSLRQRVAMQGQTPRILSG